MRKAQANTLIEVAGDEPPERPVQLVEKDPQNLRGIPVFGYGGASPGTRPEDIIDRIDDEREQRAKTVFREAA